MENLNIDVSIFAKNIINSIEEMNKVNNVNDTEKKVSPLKLQKLLYFTYVYALVNWDKKLWDNKFAKWHFGPVIENVYFEYSKFGYYPINLNNFNSSFNELTNMEKLEIECLLMELNKYSATELSDLSHTDPWKSVDLSQVITDKEILNYYSNKSRSKNDILNFNNFKKTDININWKSVPEW